MFSLMMRCFEMIEVALIFMGQCKFYTLELWESEALCNTDILQQRHLTLCFRELGRAAVSSETSFTVLRKACLDYIFVTIVVYKVVFHSFPMIQIV
jgi:hypothetical protein